MTMIARSDEAAPIGHNNPPALTIAERLAEANAERLKRLDAIAERANDAPKEVGTPEEIADAGEIAADAAEIWKELEAERVREKKPFLDGQRDVDGWFRDPLERAKRIDTALMARITAHNRREKAKADAAREASEKAAREEAAVARKAAEDAMAAGRAEDAMADLEDAHTAQSKAEAIAEAPVDKPAKVTTESGVSIGSRKVWTFEITDRTTIDLNALRDFIQPAAIDFAIRSFVRINKGTREIAGVRIFEDIPATRR